MQTAIANLRKQPNGKRKIFIIVNYYRLTGGEKKTLKSIGQQLQSPISYESVRKVRRVAEDHLRNDVALRPLIQRLVAVGISGTHTDQTLSLWTETERAAARAALSYADWETEPISTLGLETRIEKLLVDFDISTVGKLRKCKKARTISHTLFC